MTFLLVLVVNAQGASIQMTFGGGLGMQVEFLLVVVHDNPGLRDVRRDYAAIQHHTFIFGRPLIVNAQGVLVPCTTWRKGWESNPPGTMLLPPTRL